MRGRIIRKNTDRNPLLEIQMSPEYGISPLDIEAKWVIRMVIGTGKRRNSINIMTLTKRDLVTRISNESGLVQQQVLDVVQKTLDYIAESLSKGDKVELRNFGVFEVKIRKARVGRNPNAPETDVPIPERCVVKFKPGKEMRAEVIKIAPPKSAAVASPKV